VSSTAEIGPSRWEGPPGMVCCSACAFHWMQVKLSFHFAKPQNEAGMWIHDPGSWQDGECEIVICRAGQGRGRGFLAGVIPWVRFPVSAGKRGKMQGAEEWESRLTGRGYECMVVIACSCPLVCNSAETARDLGSNTNILLTKPSKPRMSINSPAPLLQPWTCLNQFEFPVSDEASFC
jgi:hypothetical protein